MTTEKVKVFPRHSLYPQHLVFKMTVSNCYVTGNHSNTLQMHAGSTFLRHGGKVEFISNLLSVVVFIRSFSVRFDIFKCLYSKIRLAFQNWIYLRWWNKRITFRKCVILLIVMFCFIFQPGPVWLLTLLQLKLGWSKRAYLHRFSVGSPSKSIHSHDDNGAELFLKVAQVWSFLQLSEHEELPSGRLNDSCC